MQIVPSMLSLLLSFLFTYLIIKKLNFVNYKIKSENIKHSAIISLIVTLLISIVISPFILIVIISITKHLKIISNSGMGVVIYIIIAILEIAPAVIIVILRKESISSLGITKKNIFKSIFVGASSYIIYIAFMIILKHRLVYIFPTNSLFSIYYFGEDFFTAIGEEILFRGYLQSRLTKWLGDKKGLILTALVFCIPHIFQRLITEHMTINNAIVSSISLLPAALLMGYLCFKCKNVIASTIFHTFYNFFQIFI